MEHGGRFDTTFDERTYRYSVKCDREKFQRIEATARKAGMSATEFVQKHFETILDEPADETGFSAGPFARRHGICEDAARLWSAMSRNADADRIISGTIRDLTTLAKVDANNGGDHLRELLDAGLLKLVANASNRRQTTYRVLERPRQ